MEKVTFKENNIDYTNEIMETLDRCLKMVSFSGTRREKATKDFFFSTTFNKCLEIKNKIWLLSPYEIWEEYANEPETMIVIDDIDITNQVQKEFNKTLDKIVEKYNYTPLEAACILRKSDIYSFLNETEKENEKKRKH